MHDEGKNHAGRPCYETGCLAVLNGHALVSAYPFPQELNSLRPIDLMLKEVKGLFSSIPSISKHPLGSCYPFYLSGRQGMD